MKLEYGTVLVKECVKEGCDLYYIGVLPGEDPEGTRTFYRHSKIAEREATLSMNLVKLIRIVHCYLAKEGFNRQHYTFLKAIR